MNPLKNWKTTLAGALNAAGLGGAAVLLTSNTPKNAAYALILSVIGALLHGILTPDAQPPQAPQGK